MSVGILILTHDLVGTCLLKAATRTLGAPPADVIALPICNDCEPEKLIQQVQPILTQLQTNTSGVLILTDLFGATPFNIAQQFNNGSTVRVVSGINLSMLIRVLNYANSDLDSLCKKALTGGKDGVINCQHKGQPHAIENVTDY